MIPAKIHNNTNNKPVNKPKNNNDV